MMIRLICLSVVFLSVLAEKPEYGSPHCVSILAVDCSGYSPEPVCAFDGKTEVTYQNSCEFAQGICSRHGHSLHAINEGPCIPTSGATP